MYMVPGLYRVKGHPGLTKQRGSVGVMILWAGQACLLLARRGFTASPCFPEPVRPCGAGLQWGELEDVHYGHGAGAP